MRLVYVRGPDGNLREHFERVEGDDAPPTEPLDLSASLDLLRRNVIGRLGFARQGRPVLLPVNYAVDEQDAVVFRTARGSKLWVAENEEVSAAFEVDEYDAESGRGIGVVVHGPMRPVTELVEAQRLEQLGVRPWADAIERPRWVRIQPERIEGWVFRGA